MRWLTGVLFAALAVAGIGSARALEPIPTEGGFSGFVGFGAVAFGARSNVGPGPDTGDLELGRATIGSLDERPPRESDTMLVVPFDVRYTFAGRRTQLFAGSGIEDLAQFDFSLELGVAHQFAGEDILAVGAVASAVPTRVWSDPYVVNQERTDTDRTSSGARVEWDRILGSGVRARYTQRTVKLDEERSGTTQLGLPAAEAARLNREGSVGELVLAYRFKPAERHTLEPQLIGTRGDLDGEAMAYDHAEVKLVYSYRGERITVVTTLVGGKRDYDAVNPVFGSTREDDTYGLGATLLYRDLFGSKDWIGLASLAAYREDSNIEFYDGQVEMVALALLYRL
jgi:hypothetical protein